MKQWLKIVLAAGLIPLAVFGSVFVGAVLLLFSNKKDASNPYIMVVRCENGASEQRALEYIRQNTKKCTIKSKSAAKGSTELNLEVRLRDDNTDFVNILADTDGISSAVLVTYNGDYMG